MSKTARPAVVPEQPWAQNSISLKIATNPSSIHSPGKKDRAETRGDRSNQYYYERFGQRKMDVFQGGAFRGDRTFLRGADPGGNPTAPDRALPGAPGVVDVPGVLFRLLRDRALRRPGLQVLRFGF